MSAEPAPTTTHFRPTRLRPGHDTHQVDGFVDSVEDALRSPRPRLSASDVARQRFTPVVMRAGYHTDDVDDSLDQAEHALEERERFP